MLYNLLFRASLTFLSYAVALIRECLKDTYVRKLITVNNFKPLRYSDHSATLNIDTATLSAWQILQFPALS
jgi:hypothetical protein